MGWLFSAAGLVGVPVEAAVLDPELPGLGVVHRRRPVCHLHQDATSSAVRATPAA
jgi:hypothetical protein